MNDWHHRYFPHTSDMPTYVCHLILSWRPTDDNPPQESAYRNRPQQFQENLFAPLLFGDIPRWYFSISIGLLLNYQPRVCVTLWRNRTTFDFHLIVYKLFIDRTFSSLYIFMPPLARFEVILFQNYANARIFTSKRGLMRLFRCIVFQFSQLNGNGVITASFLY